jgi:hypothetical protein
LQDIELGVKGGTKALFEIQLGFGDCGGQATSVLGLNIVVIGLNDGFFAGEIIIRGAEGSSSCGGEIAHGDGLEAAFAEYAESGREQVGAGELGFGSGSVLIEHVQILARSAGLVKIYFEHVH